MNVGSSAASRVAASEETVCWEVRGHSQDCWNVLLPELYGASQEQVLAGKDQFHEKVKRKRRNCSARLSCETRFLADIVSSPRNSPVKLV